MAEEFNLATAFIEIRTGVNAARADLSRLEHMVKGSANRMSGAMGMVGRAFLPVSAVLLATKAFRTLGRETLAFGEQMAFVNTMLTTQTRPLLGSMKKEINVLAAEFGLGTKELSKGLFDILSAGVEAEKALAVLRVAAETAAGGFTSVAVTADAITTLLNAYGLEADQARRVSDVLFATFKRGKTDIGELAGAIGRVATIAATAGLSLEEMGGALATITRGGISTAEAVTALRGLLQQFLDPQSEAVEVAKRFGLELSVNTLRTIGLTGAIEKLQGASAGELNVIGGQIRGFLALSSLANDLEGFLNDVSLAQNSMGFTAETAKIAQDNLANSMKGLSEATKGLFRDLGDVVDGPLKEFIDSMRQAIRDAPKLGKALEDIGKGDLTPLMIPGIGEPSALGRAAEVKKRLRAQGIPFSVDTSKGISEAVAASPELLRSAAALGVGFDVARFTEQLPKGRKREILDALGRPRTARIRAPVGAITAADVGVGGAITTPNLEELARIEERRPGTIRVPSFLPGLVAAAERRAALRSALGGIGGLLGRTGRFGAGVAGRVAEGIPEQLKIVNQVAIERRDLESELKEARLRATGEVEAAEEEAIRRRTQQEIGALREVTGKRMETANQMTRELLRRQLKEQENLINLRADAEIASIKKRPKRLRERILFGELAAGLSGIGVGRNVDISGITGGIGADPAERRAEDAKRQREELIEVTKEVRDGVKKERSVVR